MKRIAAITSVRNGAHFLDRWIAYYGAKLGHDNLHVIIDGLDQPLPDPKSGVHVHQHPFVARSRVAGDKFRAARASDLAAKLFETYDVVLATDVDEFIVVDPATGQSLASYLSAQNGPVISALGVDVACNTRVESDLDWDQPFLGQRMFGLISDRYTKASVIYAPMRWGSGQHRVKGRGFTIDPNLFLFHFGSVDAQETAARMADRDRSDAGWGAHQMRRNAVIDDVSTIAHVDGDSCFDAARAALSKPRSIIAWNKPRPMKTKIVAAIPDRFRGIV